MPQIPFSFAEVLWLYQFLLVVGFIWRWLSSSAPSPANCRDATSRRPSQREGGKRQPHSFKGFSSGGDSIGGLTIFAILPFF